MPEYKNIDGLQVEITGDELEELLQIRALNQAKVAEQIIKDQISALEAQITPRRLREALLTEEGKTWLANKEAEIQTLRNQLGE